MSAASFNPQLAEDLIQTVYPTVVCICAGMTWVDGCEKDPALANRMNCAGAPSSSARSLCALRRSHAFAPRCAGAL